MKTEQLQEGWIKFTRWYCKEGYLDRWIGDSINNPNNENQHQMCLNSMVSYWRCGGEWVNSKELSKNILSLLDLREDFTAKEIWDEVIN